MHRRDKILPNGGICANLTPASTRSSVGRASVSEAEGRWFDPSRVRQDRGRFAVLQRAARFYF